MSSMFEISHMAFPAILRQPRNTFNALFLLAKPCAQRRAQTCLCSSFGNVQKLRSHFLSGCHVSAHTHSKPMAPSAFGYVFSPSLLRLCHPYLAMSSLRSTCETAFVFSWRVLSTERGLAMCCACTNLC